MPARFGLTLALVILSDGWLALPVRAAPPSAGNSANSSANPQFWSFRELRRPELPDFDDQSVAGIDRFMLAKLRQAGLSFADQADRRTLCRRLFLDLIGLPPTPYELREFLSDESPQSIERLVDRLLSSPHYGERWGRQWLDVVGYADSNGYIRHDSPRPLAYRYRDYVIASFNADKPYDEFWREQLAGDELAGDLRGDTLSPKQIEQLTATHYLRNAPDGTDNTEGNEITRTMERYAVLEGVLQTTMSAMFGLTIECARCHDHKFDPIPQTDYYALQAVFYPAFNVKDWVQPKNRWMYAAGQTEIARWKSSLEAADREIAALKRDHQSWLTAHRPPGVIQWKDEFASESVALNWSATAPGDASTEPSALTMLDGTTAPAVRIEDGHLSLLAAGSGDSRWLSTKNSFDWTPEAIGDWVQVTFDLVSTTGPNGQPAERIGFYIALHDYDDNTTVAGGNILLDGNPSGGAGVVLDYPGGDQKGLGAIGTTGYAAGHNFGVRVTRTADDEFLLEQVVDGQPESKTLTLTKDQLPDGGFGFELCCGRSFTVDNVVVEHSPKAAGGAAANLDMAAFQRELTNRTQALEAAIAVANAHRLPEPDKIAFATDLSQTPPDVPLLERGDYFRPGAVVAPGVLNSLADQPLTPQPTATTTGRRLALAQWATQPNSRAAALLARVHVDRLWRGHFGRGMVGTPDNFGISGVGPSQPELLEWLSSEFVSSGWSQKHIHRLIVLSQTYQQSGQASSESLQRDPQNLEYSRFPMHRLAAEQIRDSMLAAAGSLNPKAGGPAVETVDHGNRQVVLPEPQGDGPHEVDRRSIYIRHRRSTPLSFLQVFDLASPDPNCVARGASTVVSQSLALLNGDFSQRMGRDFAKRIEAETPEGSIDQQIEFAFEIAYARQPSVEESEGCRRFLSAGGTLPELCRLLLASNEFLYTP